MNSGEYTFNVHRRTGIEQVRVFVKVSDEEKPYLGGLKNVSNGLVYLHAFSQTDQIKKIHPIKCHRDTQTYDYSSKSNNTHKEFGTQVERTGLWIDKRKDIPMQAQKYFTSEMCTLRTSGEGQLEPESQLLVYVRRLREAKAHR